MGYDIYCRKNFILQFFPDIQRIVNSLRSFKHFVRKFVSYVGFILNINHSTL